LPNKKNNRDEISCDFCGKTLTPSEEYLIGINAFICSSCIALGAHLTHINMNQQLSADAAPGTHISTDGEIPVPVEIKAYLDDYVIGQDDAKVAISVAVYNHYKRLLYDVSGDIQKSNILLIGGTGTGKTLLAQSLAKMLNVPFAIADATTLTEAGYVGDDVENILVRLLAAADYDSQRAQNGIIYVDEIDKIARKSENTSITRDVSGEGVQQALLKILEGTVSNVSPRGGRKHPQAETVPIDTTNILFILGGAFDGLDKIISHRTEKSTIGFGGKVSARDNLNVGELFSKVEPDDLVKFGLIPEIVGRMPIIRTLKSLSEEDLVRILVEPKNSIIRQYEKLLEFDGVKLIFERPSLIEIAKKAIHLGGGARSLRSIVEELLIPVMYSAPGDLSVKEIIITASCVTDGEEPTIVRRTAEETQAIRDRLNDSHGKSNITTNGRNLNLKKRPA
jgi:ATP-dependent Clp protease ATP-binding subunit ClpX